MDLSEILRAIRSGLKPLEAPPPLRLSGWAAEHFYLSTESSQKEQRWVAYPYQVAILDCMGDDDIEEVIVKKPARVGYTKMLLAAIGYFAEHKHRNQAVWQPTDEDADEFVKVELETMFRDVPVMQRVFPAFLQRNKNNTLRQKLMLGSVLHLRGGKAAKNYRRLTVSVVILDEVDGFDQDIQGEGGPIELALKRLEGATFPKAIIGSTPKIKDLSHIQRREANAHKRYQFHVPCPHCGHEQPLRWGKHDQEGPKPSAIGFTWIGDDVENLQVMHRCESERCGTLWTQADYIGVWERGRWIAQDRSYIGVDGGFYAADGTVTAKPRTVAFNMWSAISKQVSWAAIVREYLAALAKAATGDKSALKAFWNLTLGQEWEEEVVALDQHELKRHAEDRKLRIVPFGCLKLTAGVDVQDNRFEIRVWGFGPGMEMWVIDDRTIHANPGDDAAWAKLDEHLLTKFDHEAGSQLGIEAVGVDTGGHFTHKVYNFCRLREGRRVFAVKGETRDGQPIRGRSAFVDVNTTSGRVLKNGCRLWHVGTDTAKDLLMAQISLAGSGPGRVHLAKALRDEFFAELTAEGRVLIKTAHGESSRWVKLRAGARNETLDCTVYALFAAYMLELDQYTARMWERLASAVQPRTPDLFEQGPALIEALPAPTVAPVQTSAPVSVPIRRPATVGSDDWNARL